MEPLTLILASLISLLSPANFAGEKIIESTIRQQFKQVEVVQVRIDNPPIHQAVAGKVEKVRIATRGIYPLEGIRIDTAELETDPINFSVQELRRSDLKRGKLLLQAPLGVAVRLKLTRADLVQSLKSPFVRQQVGQLVRGLVNRPAPSDPAPTPPATNPPMAEVPPAEAARRVQILNPKVEFLGDRRIAVSLEVAEAGATETLKLEVTSGIQITDGRQIELVDPTILVNGTPLPPGFVSQFKAGLQERINQRLFGQSLGPRLRVLKFSLASQQLEVIAFAQLPKGFRL
jgi:hypothetical protein